MKTHTMTSIHATSALTTDGWRSNVRVGVSRGAIASIESGVAATADDECVAALIPGMPNVHSHAFQRGMAGLAEVRGPVDDNFWSWRTTMYRFALTMTPDDLAAVARQLYMEMLEAGFTRVGEFHYLHHDRNGASYDDVGEMATQIVGAAASTGIGLTLLPVFYAHSTFGGAPPVDGQRRFISDSEIFERLVTRCHELVKHHPAMNVGVAPHSLRAVTPEELKAVIAMAGEGPIHIHAAEQMKEVNDCIAWSGARPVEWLLDHADVNANWCLIHATHMTPDETRRLARSSATAGLCPVTEANLGDGTFDAVPFLEAGGRFGIGTDSNILVGVAEELRQLEYAQRLQHRARNVIAPTGQSTGQTLYDRAVIGGGRALQWQSGLAVGRAADFVSLDIRPVPHAKETRLLDVWIFANAVTPESVWVAGKKVVAGGRHVQRDAIETNFRRAMKALVDRC